MSVRYVAYPPVLREEKFGLIYKGKPAIIEINFLESFMVKGLLSFQMIASQPCHVEAFRTNEADVPWNNDRDAIARYALEKIDQKMYFNVTDIPAFDVPKNTPTLKDFTLTKVSKIIRFHITTEAQVETAIRCDITCF